MGYPSSFCTAETVKIIRVQSKNKESNFMFQIGVCLTCKIEKDGGLVKLFFT